MEEQLNILKKYKIMEESIKKLDEFEKIVDKKELFINFIILNIKTKKM